MCEPTTLAVAGGLMAAGMLENNRAQRGAASDREDLARAEADRQSGFALEGKAAADKSRDAYADPNAIAGDTGREDTMGRLLERMPGAAMRTPGVSSAPTGAMTNQIVSARSSEGDRNAKTKVNMQRFGDGMAQAGRASGENASTIGFLNRKAAGSNRVLGTEIGAVGSGESLLGDLLMGGGQLGMTYAMTQPAAAPHAGQHPKPKANPRR